MYKHRANAGRSAHRKGDFQSPPHHDDEEENAHVAAHDSRAPSYDPDLEEDDMQSRLFPGADRARTRQWFQQAPLIIAVMVVLGFISAGIAVWAWNVSNQKSTLVRQKDLAEQKLHDAEKKAVAAEERVRLADNRAKMAQDSLRSLSSQANPVSRPAVEPQQPEKPRSQYAADLRMAQQAYERGEVALVRQILEPYRTPKPELVQEFQPYRIGPAKVSPASEPVKQDLRNFAWYYLWRAAHSAGTTLQEHTQTVRYAAFTADGAKAVTLADDGLMITWDGLTGRKLQGLPLAPNTFQQNLSAPTATTPLRRAGGLAVALEGEWAAAFGDTVWIGNFTQQSQPQRLNDHTAQVSCLALARSGKLLASGDEQGEIILRELPGGKAVRRWKSGRPQALAFTADSKFLLAGMRHGAMYVWDAATGLVKDSETFGQPITSLAMARDGQTVAVALANREGVVCLWDPATRRVRGELRGHTDRVTCVAFSPDGKHLLTASRDHTAKLWTDTGGLVRTYRGHVAGVETAAFALEGQKIITAGSDKTAMLWKMDTDPQCEVLTDTPTSGSVRSLAFTPGNDRLIGAGRCETSEAFLGQWNLADANRPVPLQTAASFGTAIGFSPDGRLMSIGECASQDPAAAARLRIWNLETGRVMSSLPGLKGAIASASYSPDGRLLAAALGDPDEKAAGLVRVWEPGAGTQRYTLPSLAGKADAAFSSDGKWLATVTSSKRRPGEIRLWNALTGEPVAQIGSAQDLENVTAMALSPDGQSLVTGHGDLAAPTSADKAKLKLWSLATKQLASQLPTAHSAAITKIVFSRRGKLLATGDAAGNVRVWDFTTGKPLATQVPPQGRPITGLAFDRLGDRLATAADEKCVRVWHVDTAKALARMELAASTPTAVRFTPDGNFIVATTNTGGLVMWESASYRVRALLKAEGNPATQEGHAGEVSCAVATQTGTRVITGGSDKTLRVWDLASRQLLATPFTFNQPVSCLAVAPSRKMLAVGTGRVKPAFEPGEVILCIQGEGQTQAVPQTLFQGIAVTGMAFTPDGNWLAVCAMAPDGPGSQGLRESAALVNLSTGKVQSLPAGDAQTVATSPDGRLLAVGRACGDIELWRLESPSASPPAIDPKKLPEMKKPLETKKPFDPKRITQDLPSGEVVTCAFWPGDSTKPAGGSAELFPARYGSEAAQPTGASPAPTWLQPQNSGQGLGPGAPAWQAPRNAAPAMPGLQNQPSPTAPVADLVPAAKPVVLQGHRGAVKSLAFSPDGKTLASGSEDYDAKVWDVSTGEELLTFKHNGAVDAVRFSADGKVLATADREPMHGGVRLWRAAPDEFIVGPNLQPIPSAGERTTHSGAPQPWQNTDPPTRYR